jgi:hypothetical protein
MPQLTQGLIVAALIGLLLAVIVGYYLRQGQINGLREALRQSQQRQEELELEHEQRLREATLQLQKDYEAQIADKMELYQAQIEAQRAQLEAEYRSRQGLAGAVEPASADSGVEQRIRKQYEARLKEAAAKIQQAYEQHLQEKLVEVRSQTEQEYNQRLAEVIAHYQDEAQAHQSAATLPPLGALVPEGLSSAGIAGVEAEAGDTAALEARLQAEYDRRLAERLAEYQDDMDQRLAQLEQDYEARLQMAQAGAATPVAAEPSTAELELNLRREIEDQLQEEYDLRLAESIEHYKNELAQRTQELEQSYEARLQLLQTTGPEETQSIDAPGIDFAAAIAAANAADLAASLEPDLVLEEPNLEVALGPDLGNLLAEPDAGEFEFGDLEPGELDLGDGPGLDFDAGASAAPADALSDENLAALLDSDPTFDSFDPANPPGGDAGFDSGDEIDLEALLNAPAPDNAPDDLLEGLDDISDLS